MLSIFKVKQLLGADTVSSNEELQVVLQFYHDLGHIIYFGDSGSDLSNLVVLDPHWLIDVFRRIITAKDVDLVIIID